MVDSSATDVQRRAQQALTMSPIYMLRELQVERVNSSLLITGRVDSFYHKQLAQEAVRTVSDGMDVVNSIEVDRH